MLRTAEHSSPLFPSAAAVVPFLAELVRSPEAPDKADNLRVLRRFCGHWHPWVRERDIDPAAVADPTDDPFVGCYTYDPVDDPGGRIGYGRLQIAAHKGGRRALELAHAELL